MIFLLFASDSHRHPTGVIVLICDPARFLYPRIKRYPNLRTLFMSGYTADGIPHRGVLDSDVHFIHKPFSKQTLSVKVREALGGVRHGSRF